MPDETTTTEIESRPITTDPTADRVPSGSEDIKNPLEHIEELRKESAKRRNENNDLKKQLAELQEVQNKIKKTFGGEGDADPQEAIKSYEQKNVALSSQVDRLMVQAKLSQRGDIHPSALQDVAQAVMSGGVTVDRASGDVEGFDVVIENIKQIKPYFFTANGTQEQQKRTGIGTPTSTHQTVSGVDTVMETAAKQCGFITPEAIDRFKNGMWPNYKKRNRL